MSKREFENEVEHIFEELGCRKILVCSNFWGTKADVYFRDLNGKKRHFKAEECYKRGHSCIRYWDADSFDWIDEIEAFEAFLED